MANLSGEPLSLEGFGAQELGAPGSLLLGNTPRPDGGYSKADSPLGPWEFRLIDLD